MAAVVVIANLVAMASGKVPAVIAVSLVTVCLVAWALLSGGRPAPSQRSRTPLRRTLHRLGAGRK